MTKTEVYMQVATGKITAAQAADIIGASRASVSSYASRIRSELHDLTITWDRLEDDDGNALSGFLITSVCYKAAMAYLNNRKSHGEYKAAAMALKAQVEHMLDHQKKVYNLWGRKDSPAMAKINELAEVE